MTANLVSSFMAPGDLGMILVSGPSYVETRQSGQMYAVETGQMSAVETRQMSSAETRQMQNSETGQRPV